MKFLNEIDGAKRVKQDSNNRFVTDEQIANWNASETNSKAYVDGRVLTDVPLNAKFTDTITTINGKTGAISKADIVALGIPSQDTNTTYSEITTTEIDAGTASTPRTITGRRVKYILDKVQDWISSLTKTDIGLSNVDNVKQASKTEFDSHDSDTSKHITNTERNKWNTVENKVDKISGKGLSTEDYTTAEKNKLSGIATGANNYTHPTSHPASMITESSTRRFVTDEQIANWNSKSDTDTVTTINGKTGAITKADIVALGIPSTDTNTTYSEITTAEIDAGTSSTRRTITGRRVQAIVDKAVSSVSGFAPISHNHSANDINSGTLSYLRIPRGTTSTTVAIGNHTHSSFSGLTVTNPIVCSNYTSSTQSLNLKPNNGNGGIVYAFGNLRPSNGQDLGANSTTERWGKLYISTGGINEGSDIRQKDNIKDIPYDLLKYFAKEVKPKMFDSNGKKHFGYIAQDVERALYKYALDKVGFENAQEYVKEFNLLDKSESYLSLVYSQIAVVKEAELQNRIDVLEEKIDKLIGGN